MKFKRLINTHVLFFLVLLIILLLTVWNKPGQVVLSGCTAFFFIGFSVYAGRLCIYLVRKKNNLGLAATGGVLLLAVLSFTGAMAWGKLIARDQHFHSELLTVSTPVIFFWMAIGMLLYRISPGWLLKVPEDSGAATQPKTLEPVDHVFLKTDGKLFKMEFKNLLYAEASRNYTKVFSTGQPLLTPLSFTAFEKLLPGAQFMRVHRSFILNKSKISHIEGNRVFIDRHEIPIGEQYKEIFFQTIGLVQKK